MKVKLIKPYKIQEMTERELHKFYNDFQDGLVLVEVHECFRKGIESDE